MKALTFILLVLVESALPARACEKWEYAKFKDASKKELLSEHCYSKEIAELKGKGKESMLASAKEFAQLSGTNSDEYKSAMRSYEKFADEQISCLMQVDESSAMLAKKFKVKAPIKCPAPRK